MSEKPGLTDAEIILRLDYASEVSGVVLLALETQMRDPERFVSAVDEAGFRLDIAALERSLTVFERFKEILQWR